MSSEAPRSENGESAGRRLGRWRRIGLVALVAFVVGYAAAAVWMRAGAAGRSVATVPNLRELSLADARRAVEASDLVLEPTDTLPHAEVERGQVLTQSPLPGQEVAPGTAVQVILSSGRARYAIPRVEGLSREQAEEVLRATGMQTLVEEVNDPRRAGLVVGTEPAAGTVVEVPAQVRLRVSIGPPMVAVPELVGLTQDSAAVALAAAQLSLGEVQLEVRFLGVEGEVLAQQPEPGDSLPAGSAVDVTVATTRLELIGPEEFRLDREDGRRRRRER